MNDEIIEMADERVLSLPVADSHEPLVDLRKVTKMRGHHSQMRELLNNVVRRKLFYKVL